MKKLHYSHANKQNTKKNKQGSALDILKQGDQLCNDLLDGLGQDYLGYLEGLVKGCNANNSNKTIQLDLNQITQINSYPKFKNNQKANLIQRSKLQQTNQTQLIQPKNNNSIDYQKIDQQNSSVVILKPSDKQIQNQNIESKNKVQQSFKNNQVEKIKNIKLTINNNQKEQQTSQKLTQNKPKLNIIKNIQGYLQSLNRNHISKPIRTQFRHNQLSQNSNDEYSQIETKRTQFDQKQKKNKNFMKKQNIFALKCIQLQQELQKSQQWLIAIVKKYQKLLIKEKQFKIKIKQLQQQLHQKDYKINKLKDKLNQINMKNQPNQPQFIQLKSNTDDWLKIKKQYQKDFNKTMKNTNHNHLSIQRKKYQPYLKQEQFKRKVINIENIKSRLLSEKSQSSQSIKYQQKQSKKYQQKQSTKQQQKQLTKYQQRQSTIYQQKQSIKFEQNTSLNVSQQEQLRSNTIQVKKRSQFKINSNENINRSHIYENIQRSKSQRQPAKNYQIQNLKTQDYTREINMYKNKQKSNKNQGKFNHSTQLKYQFNFKKQKQPIQNNVCRFRSQSDKVVKKNKIELNRQSIDINKDFILKDQYNKAYLNSKKDQTLKNFYNDQIVYKDNNRNIKKSVKNTKQYSKNEREYSTYEIKNERQNLRNQREYSKNQRQNSKDNKKKQQMQQSITDVQILYRLLQTSNGKNSYSNSSKSIKHENISFLKDKLLNQKGILLSSSIKPSYKKISHKNYSANDSYQGYMGGIGSNLKLQSNIKGKFFIQ